MSTRGAAASDGIAIIGIGCRFPGGANSPEAFWRLLENGFNAIAEAPASRPGFRECFDADPRRPGRAYSRWGGFLDRVDLFDAQFFGISPREAAHIDPQHRLLLELVWEACEDAGVPPTALAGSRTGVFVGISTHDYGDLQMYPSNRADIDMHTNSGTATSIAANRISYHYDLRGPSVAIDTACSSSLSALHFCCQSLRAGECDVAFAGGVQILLTPELTIGFCKASMLSPDGECRAFAADANGYVRSEGAGVVMLKPVAAALRDGDPIYAVIRATVVNQDGRTPGMTVPSQRAQQAMIEEALCKAGVAPGDIQYVEAHGPGTRVGDPIEAAAIGAALGRGRGAGEPCAIGSVKTNLGHLEAASGMPGLIKVALSLQHQAIPPSLHFHQASEALDLQALGLRVVTTLEPWPRPRSNQAALAGVNSFGFGGANAHVLLQEAPQRVAPAESGEPVAPARLLALSARSPQALTDLASAYAERLRADDAPAIRDVCFTTAERRAHHEFRLSVIGHRTEEFAERLLDFVSGGAGANLASGRAAQSGPPRVAFVFSGMGPQWWGMGRQLRDSEPVFRRTLEQCAAALKPYAEWSLLEELSRDEATSRVAAPELAQVTNFAIQVALASVWESWGITPAAVIGHSGGAMAAAYVAGVHDLDDAMRLTYHRSRLQGRPANAGRMLAVGAPMDEIAPLLSGADGRISLAAVNGPSAISLAGDGEMLEQIAEALLARQIFARFLPVTIAYHSPAMDPIKDEFLAAVAGLSGKPARIPWLSDTTGAWTDGTECDAQFWWRAIRQPVLFRDGITSMLNDGIAHFVEVGPHPVLSPSIVDCMKGHGTKGAVWPSLRRTEDERVVMLRSLGALYAAGCMPAWQAIREKGARVVPLPHYSWQRERHWFEPTGKADHLLSIGRGDRLAGAHPLLGGRLRSARPAWENLLGAAGTEYLRQHIVHNAAVCPGAAYVEMALAANAAIDGPSPVALRDIEFVKALRLPDDDGTLTQVTLDPDGRFEVLSAASTEGASWTCHSRGVVTTTKRSEDRRVDLDAWRERCSDEVSVEDFYTRMAERGLGYGSYFRGIHRLWSNSRKALAKIATPDVSDVGSYRVHPALLDAAFQVLVAAAESDSGLAGGHQLFLPTRIRDIRFRAEPGLTFWVAAAVTDVTGATVTGDLRIVNETGDVLVDIAGFTARLVDVASRGDEESVDQWLYEYRWELQPRAAPAVAGGGLPSSVLGPLPAGRELDEICQRATVASVQTGWRDYYDHVETRLNEIAAAYIVEAFGRLGCLFQAGARLSLDRVVSTGDWRRSLATELLGQLVESGMLRPAGNEWEATGIVPRAAAGVLGDQLLQDYPGHRLDVELLHRAGPRLAEVLEGRAHGRDVLFTDDGFEFLEQFYRESPASAFYNGLLASVVADFAARRSMHRPLRVLEVGAGTGGTTSLLLPRLAEDTARYVFSDVSALFLERAKTKFREYPALSTTLFDIARDATAEGIEPSSFDLVIAANVLHATPVVEPAMRRLCDLLAPGGALVILEITRHPRWLDIVFGLMDGWWAFADRNRRPSHPLMRGDAWQGLLEECGLETVAVIADEVEGEPAQSVIVGRRSVETARPATSTAMGDASQQHWLILADQKRGIGQRLAAILEAGGHRSTLYTSGGDVARIADEMRPSIDRVTGVIHLWNLDAPELTTDASYDEGQAGCESLLRVLQTVVAGSPLAERRFVVVTAGAQTTGSEQETPALLQAPAWGFARTLRKEWPALRSRLIDLSADCTETEVIALADEVVGDTAAGADDDIWEEEIALRGDLRFVHRLHSTSRARMADAAPLSPAAPNDSWRAEIPVVGALDGIRMKRFVPTAPGPHEIEIAIDAASLNFRDVVVATGVVAGLEADNTFGSRRLGIDFAGTVMRCGEGVEHLKSGDAVVGIAPGAFASSAVTSAALVARRPLRLTAEEASTIPVAFITVWYALGRLARLARDETILIHAASGGVGLAAIQMAKSIGARIFATAGSPVKRSFVESLGVDGVMDSRALDFADEVLARTGGRGVDVVLNSLPGEAFARGIGALAPYGRFVELGKTDIYQNHRLDLGPFKRNLSLFAVDLDRMCVERPALVGEMLQEVVAAFDTGRFQPPPRREFDMVDLAEAMRFMGQAKHIGKVVVRRSKPVLLRAEVLEQPPVRADRTYLVTGGLGGLGLVVAEWLIERGANTVVLMGRNAPSANVVEAVDRLRSRGARVDVVAADVTRSEDVCRVVSLVRQQGPPLGGIVHAAMVLDDTPIDALDEARLARVMAPKALGAWHLHQQTLDDPLDFFVSFSSITSLLGNPLQANYAAANAFLDAFATYRRRQGRPATTINWGVITGAGYVARHQEIESYLNRQGYLSSTPQQTLNALSTLLQHDATQVMAARIDWTRFAESAPRAAASPQIRHLIPAVSSPAGPSPKGMMRALLAGERPIARTQRVEQFLREQLARLLGAAPATIDAERPFTELGLDSLIAIELTLVVERDFGIEMKGATLLGGTSLQRLAADILGLLDLETAATLPNDRRSEGPPAIAQESATPTVAPAAIIEPAAGAPVDYRALDYSRWSARQRAIKTVTAAGFTLLARIDAQGLEQIPREGPCLLAVNHLSMADVPLMLTLLERRTIILAVDQLKQFPILDWFVSDMGQAIYVRRNQTEEESLRQALTALDAGALLAVAPEGTRSKTGLAHGRTGVAYLATRADVPVVPLAAWGQELWRTRWKRISRIPIHVRVGSPMRFPSGDASAADLRKYTDQIMTSLAMLLPTEYRGVYRQDSLRMPR